MSFEDWYHPDRNSPDGRSPTRAGAEAGLQIGSLFGPAGAAIGTMAGGLVGAVFGSSGARKRARRRATNAAYDFAEELFRYGGEVRTRVNTQYDRDVSSLTARYAASGGEANEAFRLQRGKLRQSRDRELGTLDEEIQTYRQGENYEWFRKDYERVTGVSANRRGGKEESSTTFRLGGTSRSSRRHNMPTPYGEVKGIRTTRYTRDGSSWSQDKTISEYWRRIRPSMAMYERLVFGGKEGKKEYLAYMNERVAEANKWYDRQSAIDQAEAARRARRQQEQDNKR